MLDRTKVTFGQAEGVAPLPAQLTPATMSAELKAALWFVVHSYMKEDIVDPDFGSFVLGGQWRTLMLHWFVLHRHGMVDAFDNSASKQIAEAKSAVTSSNYVKVFDFLQFVVRSRYCPDGLPEDIRRALERTMAGWRLVDRTFFPVGSSEEATAIERAFQALQEPALSAPRSHLKSAAESLTTGRWSDSARESIHAVESAAKVLDPKARTLPDALKRLRKGSINPNLRQGLLSLYNYTSDEGGIRHALVDGPNADVTEADALFMLGACASFVSYLLNAAKPGAH